MINVKRAIDLQVVCLVFFISMGLSSRAFTLPNLTEILITHVKVLNLFLFIGYLALSYAIFLACGFYRPHHLIDQNRGLSEILLGVTLSTLVLLVLSSIINLEFATNKFFAVFWLLSVGAFILSYLINRWLLHLARLRGRYLRHVIIIGEGEDAITLANHIRKEANLGYHVVQIIDAREIAENGRLASTSRT
jgi:FlaA1/EpsC-like NDP-sugar epimerase